MRVFRNKEIRHELLASLCITLIFSAAVGIYNFYLGLTAAAGLLLLSAVHLVFLKKRYDKLAFLSESIDRVLHGNDSLEICEFSEGELGILSSEIHKMTVRLRESQRQLLDDKVYLADSIADISHQIRTPLTSINITLGLLSEAGLDDSRRTELIRQLHSLISRIDRLITALLKISKLDAGTVRFKKERVELSHLCDSALLPLEVPLELKGITADITATGCALCDTAWTAEALGNIIKNCMEHTAAGGSITVNASENALYSEIVISDNGCGIDKEDLAHIFERFYKGKSSGADSFGIGLALSRMIITSQNGTVKAENITPHGARFTVKLYK